MKNANAITAMLILTASSLTSADISAGFFSDFITLTRACGNKDFSQNGTVYYGFAVLGPRNQICGSDFGNVDIWSPRTVAVYNTVELLVSPVPLDGGIRIGNITVGSYSNVRTIHNSLNARRAIYNFGYGDIDLANIRVHKGSRIRKIHSELNILGGIHAR